MIDLGSVIENELVERVREWILRKKQTVIVQFNYVFSTNVDLVLQSGRFAKVNEVFSEAQYDLPISLVFSFEEPTKEETNNSVVMETLMIQAAIEVYRAGFKVRGLYLTTSSLTKELSEWKELENELQKQEYNVNFTYVLFFF